MGTWRCTCVVCTCCWVQDFKRLTCLTDPVPTSCVLRLMSHFQCMLALQPEAAGSKLHLREHDLSLRAKNDDIYNNYIIQPLWPTAASTIIHITARSAYDTVEILQKLQFICNVDVKFRTWMHDCTSWALAQECN